MEWFKKSKSGIESKEKKNIPEGLWTKCTSCGEIVYSKKMEQLLWVCPNCSFHFRISSRKYIGLLLDGGKLEEYDKDLTSKDPLKFKDSKKYPDRIKAAQQKSGAVEGVTAGMAGIEKIPVSFAIMDFSFIGGSMGSVVGEKIGRAIERAIEQEVPLIIVSCSGGARMQEGILSLMQMAKTSALLAILSEKCIPYISILTNPTTAGVMASYASLGDVIIAEPKALLGFAGPRVIQQTIGQDLPEGFQSSEFFLEKGFLDKIVPRQDLRNTVVKLLRAMWRK
ncbi:MAG: acetyl-CoA carboxylase, carboxyltransferase subunit beta [candidate division Zixibacteria bacterium]|nr:acetyl-CoA carboxylase, carboxyltransferase subunit beta [candidate division Zixibacteria bacterium]MDH3938586.1 acetyl-CoA carboxylase, carboxyltransferase subunit beta [candidate division Zixibacteria bacterium]MDH4033685.1 acetyl-CoA carboxylase, carboxyltransferase subunit beta [candidate division Zixibacteria bacterium]